MNLSNFVKSGIVFYFSLFFADSLNPAKLPSGKDRVYKYNRNNPELDLKKITPMEASFISRHWLNNILQPKKICEEDKIIVDKINSLEEFIQEQFTQHNELGVEYLAWAPQGITSDILFLIIMEKFESNYVLRILINSPFWESKQIGTECLLESLTQYSKKNNKELNIDDFLSKNIRYKLVWKDIQKEMFD